MQTMNKHNFSEMKVARPNRIVEMLLADRHSLPLSIALHLVPGALIVAACSLPNRSLKLSTTRSFWLGL